MLRLRPKLRGERGQAMVEMAISMLFIVPLILYSVMLSDMLIYRLNLQEAVGSTTWDLTVRDFEGEGSSGNDNQGGGALAAQVGWEARMLYCDHTSAYDSYNQANDCQSEDHHSAPGAHQCWIGESGNTQIECTQKDRLLGASYTDSAGILSVIQMLIPSASGFADSYTKGGFYTCHAQLTVYNAAIPQDFLPDLSNVELSEKERITSGLHGTNQSKGYTFAKYEFGVLTDTWALNTVVDIDPNGDRRTMPLIFHQPGDHNARFHRRVEDLYTSSVASYNFGIKYGLFIAKSISQKLLMPGVVPLATSDPREVHMSVIHGKTPGEMGRPGVSAGSGKAPPPALQMIVQEGDEKPKYHSSPWKDWGENPYKKTYDNRGIYYLGCKTMQGC